MTSPSSPLDDPQYRRGVLELLGLLAYGELSAAERLADDAKLAPSLRSSVDIGRMSVEEFGHFESLSARLSELGADPFEIMERFAPTFRAFHRNTAPKTWLEGLTKVYVSDGLATDFYREIAAFLDPETRDLVIGTLSTTGYSEVLVSTVRSALEADPSAAGPLALWARRLMGEVLVQAQLVVTEHDALTSVVVGGAGWPEGFDLAAISRMFTRLTEAHTERMSKLGLTP